MKWQVGIENWPRRIEFFIKAFEDSKQELIHNMMEKLREDAMKVKPVRSIKLL